MALLLRYWSQILAAVIGGLLVWFVHTMLRDVAEIRHAQAMEAQQKSLVAECAASKQKSQEAFNDFQKRLDTRDGELAAARRLLADRPTVLIRRPAGQSGQTAPAGEHGAADGVDTGTFLDFAGECEGYRLQVSGLLDFVGAR
ncbi:hypothetical protein [Methylopila sp. 73B]|uniref:hypothetical protein n=1 Tax=Methylopila sp. 73B TaxID=1120792 RepID=UPI00037E4FAD|nr:hypothetical protein [Methylopila sp. 73B]